MADTSVWDLGSSFFARFLLLYFLRRDSCNEDINPVLLAGQPLVILLYFASILACLLWQTRIKRDERDDVELQSEIKMADKKNVVCLLVFMYACLHLSLPRFGSDYLSVCLCAVVFVSRGKREKWRRVGGGGQERERESSRSGLLQEEKLLKRSNACN